MFWWPLEASTQKHLIFQDQKTSEITVLEQWAGQDFHIISVLVFLLVLTLKVLQS